MNHIDPQISLNEAISAAGNQIKLAQLLNVKKSNVSMWKNSGTNLPAIHAYRFRELLPTLTKPARKRPALRYIPAVKLWRCGRDNIHAYGITPSQAYHKFNGYMQ